MTINNLSSHVDPTRKREIGKSSSAAKIPPPFRRRHSPPAYTIVVPLVPTTTEHSDPNVVSNPITIVIESPAANVMPSNLLSPSSMRPSSLNSVSFDIAASLIHDIDDNITASNRLRQVVPEQPPSQP
ncbi:hypothetical protein J1N35_002978 [Gossypium stocksii]|uniref:Uncharacterized protein n=1 Tax=Gossypium stocksii TaxID=47602 RepID=A0A9D3WN41_9ROSI|nr:hypothetical protein J1N35_002978 [Gossypium stocksii]